MSRRRPLLLETLEDRILCSATAPVDPVAVEKPADVSDTAQQALVSPAPAAPSDQAALPPANSGSTADSTSAEPAGQRAEIVFVDTSVASYQALLAGLNPGAEVVLLQPNQDGLQQMAQALAGRTGIDAIHVISHGSTASFTVGNTTLTTENMQGQYASILQAIGQSLGEDGDLLIYGCNFGKGADGLLASATLARITGADVASSTNNTGSASKGGDWVLEAQTGAITTEVAVGTAAQQQWSGLLAPPPVQFFYIPLPEQSMLASMQAINGAVNGTTGMDSLIVITATENNTIIYYDQWENGYETNLAVPTQTAGTAQTQIWGDGDATNGATPGAAPGTDPAINAGTIITLRNTIPLPRVPANVFFDGGDKIGSSKTISISRAQIPLPTGSVISSAVEVRDTRYFDTSYTAPVGANTPRPAGVGTLFSDDFLYVMASQDNTTVQIDADNNGAFEQTVVLNEGQNLVSTTNVNQGGRVVASKPVQVNLFTGNDAASYATRSYSLLPDAQLTNDYFTPVGDSGDDIALFVYNPNAVAITVSFETQTTSGTLPVVAAGATQFFVVPGDTGTRLFTAGGEIFAAVGAHDTAGVGSAHDWGFSLQPTASLSQIAVVGLGVGNSTNPPSAGGINVSPIWVTPISAATVFVDNDGDPTTGLFLDGVTGTRYDQSFALAKLQTQRITDTTGGDQNNSGMRLFTNDGTLISTAWGEDTAAPAGAPGFDAGTTVPAVSVPELYKTVDFAPGGDANGDGYFNSNDTLRYTLRIRNIGTEPVTNAAISDALPTSLVTYVTGTTFIDQGSGAVVIPDGGVTAFPLDEGGFTIVNLAAGNTTTVSFDVTVNSGLPTGIASVYNVGRLAYLIYNIPAVNDAMLRGTVTGAVYVDQNNDGDEDAGEPPIAGVTLTLTGTDILGAAVSKVVITDALGRYVFTDLKESDAAGYTVTQTQPTGYADGLEARGGVVIPGSAGGPNAITAIVVMPGENDTDNNFGELGASLSGTVYGDIDNDGTKQVAETGIAGATVTLTGTDIAGNAVNVNVLTDASGNYTFTNLRQSDAAGYTLTETQPAGFLDGQNTAGTSGGTTVNNPPSDLISAITLAANTAATGYNFGELSPTSLSGTVYNDLNNDGIQLGAGETGINAVTVTLTGTDDLGVAVNTSTTTNASGAYTFTSIRPGTYTLTETQPAGLLDGRETAGAGVTTPGTVNNAAVSNTISNIVVASGQTGTANNFGELPASSFAGTVFIDANNDGVQFGAGETGINAATVTLTGTDDFGAAVNLSTSTNASGAYAFGTLRPGTYTITETQPAGFLDGQNTAGTSGGTTVNNPPSDLISAITLAANTAATGYNFGELQGATISGSAYIDANNDGVFQGGETAQPGVTIALTGTDDLGNAVSLTTTTNASGAYTFTTLRPGTYTLTETQPAGLLDGRETAGGGVTTPGTVNNAIDNNTIAGIVIASGQTGAANNFGDLAPSALAATAYRDLDNDGIQSGAGETGISGATVTLTGTDDRGNAVSTAALTDGSGDVSFTNLRPGTYTITETQPAGFLDGTDSNGTPAGTLTNDQISNIALASATDGGGYMFGELPATSISGTVYRDLNNDGLIAGAGETGVGGVTVALTGTDDLGAAVNVSTATAADGSYTLTGLRPSDAAGYTLTETQPAGFLDGKNTAGSAGGATVNNPASDIISGVVVATAVGATGYNFGELPPATLSGSAYIDANNDGVRQGGESGIAGVTVTLTGTDDLGNAVNASATTDATGAYAFGTLRPSDATGYTITETQPAAYGDGTDAIGTQGGTTGNDVLSGIVLSAGVGGTGNNFGERIVADLSITKTDGSATYTPGTAISYTVVVSNSGPSFVSGALVADTIPANISGATWTAVYAGAGSTGAASGSGDINTAIDLASGGSATFTITGTVLATATGNLVNTATVAAPAGVTDPTPGNNTATDTDTPNPVADLTITKTDGVASVVPGTANTYTIVVSNVGPSFVTGATVADTLPATLTGVSWTAVYAGVGSSGAASGVGNISTVIDLAVGGTATFTVTGTVASTATGTLVNTATVTPPVGTTDPTPGNNTATDTDTLTPEADLSITKTDGSATYIPGTAITYTVVVSNAGPSFVNSAVVADAIPANIVGATWTAAYAGAGSAGAASGSGDINTAIDLASGGTATFTISGTVLSTATGNLVNTATVTAPAGVTDPTPANNTATDTDTANPVADLSITKTDGSATYIPGTAISYTVVVNNTGPSFVSGAVVADTIPANISGATWTAVYAGAGSAGAASGSGDINTAIDLASGGSATFTITGTVLATATGNLVNTATVAAPAGVTDPTPGNNTATDTDTANLTADLSITKTDGVASVVPGTANTYTIVVSNTGPSFVTGATVADTLPATLTGVSWTAVYAGAGSSGAASGVGNISTVIDLAVGGTATFTVTGTVASTATGTLVNTATVTPPVAVTDPTPGNNTATDTDTLTPVADLSVTKTDGSATYISGTAITYTVVVSNSGPSFVNGAVVADAIPADISGATWTAVYAGVGSAGAASGSGDINTTIDLASGGSATFTITGTVLLTATGNLVNTATVTPPAPVTDPTPGNNTATDTDTRDLTSLAGFVFSDANNDGFVQVGESGIAGATVTLTGTDNLGGAVNLSVTTLADGSYSFINLRPSNAAGYTMTETQPASFLDGTDIIGTPGGVAGNDVFSTIVLAQGVSGTDNNFGELAPSSLAGSVYNDTNNDGIAQVGESGIAGVTVTLTGANDQGAIAPIIATTLADGSYAFGNLRPGTYAITETQPGAFLDGADTIGTPGGATGADTFTGILLATGTNGTANNFGELRPATLSGTVFQDDSNDGAQQPGESGVANVSVTLTGTDDLGSAVNVTVNTLADGSYTFGNLRPGTYTITETQPAGLLDGLDALGTAGGALANDAASAITLTEGQTGSGYTFGEIVASSFAGTVFSDLDNNGAIDPGEPGIGGAAVTLTGTDDLGNTVSLSTSSAPDGTYGFGNLRPGTYVLTETQPAGFLDGQNTAGTAGGTTVNNPLSDAISAITLPSNTAATGYLFGELAPASFNGTVFHDLNNDGVNDPTDFPIGGATVTLTGTDDLGNAVNTGATSAADGTYTFANLRPGTYTLTETQPAGYLDGIDTAGTTGGTPANDTFSAIALAVGQTGGGYLFGERTPPDLVVTKTDGISIALPGDLLTYTITVANVSLQQADSVTVTDQFPSALQFLGASNGGTFDAGTGVITWNVGAIAGSNAQTVTLTVSARVPGIIPASLRSVTNSVTATDISGLDATPANNTASDTDGIPSTADLYVLKTDRLENTNVGDRTSYTITGGNAGGRLAERVVVTDTLPPGVRFLSASNGGQLVNGRIVWNLGDLPAGATFQLTVRVQVEIAASGQSLVNNVSITDRFGSFEDATPFNNSATDTTQVVTFFSFDAFHNSRGDRDEPFLPGLSSPHVTRDALLPLAPIYSGEAAPGATLVIALYNAKGENIGSQTVVADAGGNWLASFPSTTVRDTPQSVQITQLSASYSLDDSPGHNLRTYFSPALNPGHFFESILDAGLDSRPAPLLEGLGLENPLQLGPVKYGGEVLGTQSTASGY